MEEIRGLHYQTRKPLAMGLKNGKIDFLNPVEEVSTTHLISPGWVDLQVNGFKGIDFNEPELTREEVVALTKTLWKEGVTSYFPTLITNSDEQISKTLQIILRTCHQYPLVNETIQGIHLEGPFLSKEDGPRGAHPPEYIKAPDWDLFKQWQTQAEGKIKLITLSPEWDEAPSFIERCVKSGTRVAIGHTSANAEQIEKAVIAGATLSTHLGNATHLKLPRHKNYIIDQLATESLWASFIADGFHLPKPILKLFLKIKKEQAIIVSDSTKFAGLPPGKYITHIGGKVELDDKGKLFIQGHPKMLAGSAQSLKWCIEHLVRSQLVPLGTALQMASLQPLKIVGVSQDYELRKGASADLVILSWDQNKIKIIQTIKSGKTVYKHINTVK